MRLRRIIIFCMLAVPTALLGLYVAAQTAIGSAAERVVTIMDAPTSQVVIVPGASVLPSGAPSDVLEDRLLAAVALYRAQKVRAILVSGDHGTDGYDEPNAMRRYLLAHAIPADVIFLDHAGFDTYDTMYRARHVFGVTTAIIATQTFHLPRALFIGNALGMTTYGVAAERQAYVKDDLFAMRERFANVKAYVNILFGAQPTYGGATFDITGDGRQTWDTETGSGD